MCYLFDLLVKPVMDYASEFHCVLEIIHRKFCKFALGVSTKALNLAVYGELGRVALSIHRKVQMVKFWCRLSVDDDLPVYLREAYLLAKNQRLDWYNSITDVMKSIGLDHMCDHLTVSPNTLISEVKQHLMNQFMQDRKTQLQSTMEKLQIYKEIKHDFNYESY